MGTSLYIIKTIVALLSISPPPLPQLYTSLISLLVGLLSIHTPVYECDQRHCHSDTFISEISDQFASIGTWYISIYSNTIVAILSISATPPPQRHFS